jgi:hypothetical protein
MRHPHVKENEASRPVINEVLAYLDELQTMTTRDEGMPTPKFAMPRFHDILFVVGGSNRETTAVYTESYSTETGLWTMVSCTHLHSYRALLSNYKCPLNSNLLSDCTQHYYSLQK